MRRAGLAGSGPAITSRSWTSSGGTTTSGRFFRNIGSRSASITRNEAIRNKAGGAVCQSSDGTACTGNWSDGWLVWADTNGNGALNAGEAVLRYSQARSKLTVGNTGGTVAFDARGRRLAAVNQSLTLRPDECGGQPLQSTLAINASGQVTLAKGACP